MTLKPATRFACLATFLLTIGSIASASTTNPPAHPATSKKVAAYGKLPLQFEVNQGQADPRVKMLARGQGYNILLQPTTATFDLHRTAKGHESSQEAVRMSFVGASQNATLTAEQKLPGYVNYMVGPDHSNWQTGVSTFAQVRATAIYPGVDAIYYGTGRQLEFDMVVAAGADASAIQLAIVGANPVLGANGELVLAAGQRPKAEDIRLRRPVLYQNSQTSNGRRELVEGAFTVAADGTVGFKIGAYDHTRELVIDPILSYASYFGGAGEDEINGTAINASNQLYAVGQSYSASLPGTAGEFQTGKPTPGGHSAFITKFSADGTTVLWTTFLAGSQDDFATSVAVGSADQPYIAGYTNSCGANNSIPGVQPNTAVRFPFTSDAVQTFCSPVGDGANLAGNGGGNTEVNGASYDAFLVKLSSDGKTELYGTPLGGSNNDFASSVVLDATGQVYLVGETSSTSFTDCNGNTRCTSQPTYPGGVGISNYPTTGNAFYTNTTESRMYSSTDPNTGISTGPADEQGFLTVLSADLHSIVYSSLIGGGVLGGSGNGTSATNGIAIAVNANGIAYIGGNTSSAHWPVSSNAFAKTCANAGAANSTCNLTGWLAAFDPTKSGASSLLFSTYVNGVTAGTAQAGGNLNPSSDVYGLTTDSTGNAVVTGDTNATDFPTTQGTLQPACVKFGDGNGDANVCDFEAYVTKVSPAGSIVWSTFLGPTVADGGPVRGMGVALDAKDNVFALAINSSTKVPLKNSVATLLGTDAYLVELSPDASTLTMGTFLGAGGGISVNTNALHLDAQENAYFGGSQGYNTYGGTYLPATPGAFQSSLMGNADGFVIKFITQQQPSATALTVSPATTAKPTDTVTLTATVTTTSTLTGSYLPTGVVTFLNGSTSVGTAALNAKGVATFSGMLPAGTYTITANYPGDAGFNASVSPAAPTLTVTSATATTTALSVVPTTSAYGTSATLTATVMAGNSPATSGVVTFTAGSLTLGTANINASGVASLSVKPAVGVYSVIAAYAGTATQGMPNGFAPSTSAGTALTITKASTTAVLTSSNANAGTGVNVTLTATVSTVATGVTAPGGLVTFMNGTTSLGTATVGAGGMATLVTSFSTAGIDSLTAVYAGDTNYTGSTSAALMQVAVTPSFTVAASPASLTIARGSTGTTTLTFTPAGGYSGLVSLSCGTLPSKATCTFSPASVTLAGSPVSSTLTISTGSLMANLILPTLKKVGHGEVFSASTAVLPAMLFGLLLCFRRKQFRKWTGLTVLLLATSLGVIAGMTTGCSSSPSSSGSNGANATPAGSYTISVTGTATSGTPQAISIVVVVQ
jgi:hypothetical protein